MVGEGLRFDSVTGLQLRELIRTSRTVHGAIPGAKVQPHIATRGIGLLSCLIQSESGVVDLAHEDRDPVALSADLGVGGVHGRLGRHAE